MQYYYSSGERCRSPARCWCRPGEAAGAEGEQEAGEARRWREVPESQSVTTSREDRWEAAISS